MTTETGPDPTGHQHDWQPRNELVTRDAVEHCTICDATRSHRGTLLPRARLR